MAQFQRALVKAILRSTMNSSLICPKPLEMILIWSEDLTKNLTTKRIVLLCWVIALFLIATESWPSRAWIYLRLVSENDTRVHWHQNPGSPETLPMETTNLSKGFVNQTTFSTLKINKDIISIERARLLEVQSAMTTINLHRLKRSRCTLHSLLNSTNRIKIEGTIYLCH